MQRLVSERIWKANDFFIVKALTGRGKSWRCIPELRSSARRRSGYQLSVTCTWLVLQNRILFLLISHVCNSYTARKHVLSIKDGATSEIYNEILFTCIYLFENNDTLIDINSCHILIPLVCSTENASITKMKPF